MKIARSVRLLRFGGLLVLGFVVDGVDCGLGLRFDGVAMQVKAGATGREVTAEQIGNETKVRRVSTGHDTKD
jgi:hypothetical protein